tara:strand:- start:280 stop:411 length:132 start_codon:yes stop_codon:yes gene_type:complete
MLSNLSAIVFLDPQKPPWLFSPFVFYETLVFEPLDGEKLPLRP